MRMDLRRAFRILTMATLLLLTSQYAGARAGAPKQSEVPAARPAKAAPQHPAQKPVTPAKLQEEPTTEEEGDQAASESDAEVQKQLMNELRHQYQEEMTARIKYGRSPTYSGFDKFIDETIPFFAFLVVTWAILSILRIVLDNRRWNKMVKVQTETHAKLLERFGASQELLAYMQSEAGKKFLETPIFEAQRRQISTLPFGRILWSVQIGVVAAFLGAGFLFLRGNVTPPDMQMGFQIFGTLVLTLGVGFLVSGGVSYVLAKYWGLLERPDELARAEHGQ